MKTAAALGELGQPNQPVARLVGLGQSQRDATRRVDRLRQLTGRAAPVAGETIAAGEVAGIQAGARYRLMRELGRGATGVVYLARDAELDRDVAVKLLHPHLAGNDKAESLARFFHEARVMASLRHPNVVAVLGHDPPVLALDPHGDIPAGLAGAAEEASGDEPAPEPEIPTEPGVIASDANESDTSQSDATEPDAAAPTGDAHPHDSPEPIA